MHDHTYQGMPEYFTQKPSHGMEIAEEKCVSSTQEGTVPEKNWSNRDKT